jgi:regulator of sigma E protease
MIELLSPAGSPESVIAAVQNGADAVYLGLGDFNARRGAKNFTDEEFRKAMRYCRVRGCKVYVTLNTLVGDREMEAAVDAARLASDEGADGLMVGDRFVKVDGRRVYQYYDVSDFLRQGDGVYDLVLRRDGKTVTLRNFAMTPRLYEGQERELFGFNFGYEEATLPVKLRYSWDTAMEFGRMVWMGLGQLLHGEVGLRDMSGPVGIVDLMAETGESAESTSDAVYDILYLGAFIAVNLAIMNMLPIPALDGGRVFLLLVTLEIETVIRRKLDPKYESWIHAGGMALLLTLMAVIMFNDILKLFQ